VWVTIGDLTPNRATVTGVYPSEDAAYRRKDRGERVVSAAPTTTIGERIWLVRS
jgi:hypothetical protein